jgi:hypothetical protein
MGKTPVEGIALKDSRKSPIYLSIILTLNFLALIAVLLLMVLAGIRVNRGVTTLNRKLDTKINVLNSQIGKINHNLNLINTTIKNSQPKITLP